MSQASTAARNFTVNPATQSIEDGITGISYALPSVYVRCGGGVPCVYAGNAPALDEYGGLTPDIPSLLPRPNTIRNALQSELSKFTPVEWDALTKNRPEIISRLRTVIQNTYGTGADCALDEGDDIIDLAARQQQLDDVTAPYEPTWLPRAKINFSDAPGWPQRQIDNVQVVLPLSVKQGTREFNLKPETLDKMATEISDKVSAYFGQKIDSLAEKHGEMDEDWHLSVTNQVGDLVGTLCQRRVRCGIYPWDVEDDMEVQGPRVLATQHTVHPGTGELTFIFSIHANDPTATEQRSLGIKAEPGGTKAESGRGSITKQEEGTLKSESGQMAIKPEDGGSTVASFQEGGDGFLKRRASDAWIKREESGW